MHALKTLEGDARARDTHSIVYFYAVYLNLFAYCFLLPWGNFSNPKRLSHLHRTPLGLQTCTILYHEPGTSSTPACSRPTAHTGARPGLRLRGPSRADAAWVGGGGTHRVDERDVGDRLVLRHLRPLLGVDLHGEGGACRVSCLHSRSRHRERQAAPPRPGLAPPCESSPPPRAAPRPPGRGWRCGGRASDTRQDLGRGAGRGLGRAGRGVGERTASRA